MTNPNYTFKKRILIPFWVIRGFLVVLFIIAFAVAINMTNCQYDDPEFCELNDQARASILPAMIVFFVFLIIVALCDIVQIALFVKNKMKPGIFLVLNAVQCGFWLGVFFADIASMARDGGANALTIGIIMFILVLYVPMLVYASIGYHRQRKQLRLGNYALTYNPAQQESHHNLPIYQGQTTSKPAAMV